MELQLESLSKWVHVNLSSGRSADAAAAAAAAAAVYQSENGRDRCFNSVSVAGASCSTASSQSDLGLCNIYVQWLKW